MRFFGFRSAPRALATALVFTALAQAGGCGTDAEGVDACRDIELARCQAAKLCGSVTDEAACRRFYRDQCLHGLPVRDPGESEVEACVAVLDRAAVCAAEGPDTPLDDCAEAVSVDVIAAGSVCDLVAAPELALECSFLKPSSRDPDSTAGGGAGGAGEGGSGGAAEPAPSTDAGSGGAEGGSGGADVGAAGAG